MNEIIGGYVPISHELNDMTYGILPDYWLKPGVGLRIRMDPLGSVNKIISIIRHNPDRTVTTLKSLLYPIREGSVVNFGEEGSGWDIGPSWRTLVDPSVAIEESKPHVWYVEVDDRRIIEIPWSSALPDPIPVPSMPWYREIRWSISNWRTIIANRIAHKLGYQRIGECECDDY